MKVTEISKNDPHAEHVLTTVRYLHVSILPAKAREYVLPAFVCLSVCLWVFL